MSTPWPTITEPQSHWQRGCNDAKAGRPADLPYSYSRYSPARSSYENGYRFGLEQMAEKAKTTVSHHPV